ncbi:MAG: hypothetical protein IPM52_03400 [Bacteroidetes bacterium]|nr:hypothetical protein [Bacteroidota bacterium]
MISIGYNIKQPNDVLRTVEVADLARRIRQPDKAFVDFINQLRILLSIDPRRYRDMKTHLPYVVAASFNPPYRRIENFASCSALIIDLDHLQAKGINMQELRRKINADPRVLLSFCSPSGDGLKVMFRFEPKFTDPARYSIFYKLFATRLAAEYNVHQVIDKSTSDVSRACFVSYDPEVYFNPEAEPVKWALYVDFENHLSLNELLDATDEAQQKARMVAPEVKDERTLTAQDLPDEILQKIKDQLNPARAAQKEKRIYVPPEVEQLLPRIASALQAQKLTMTEVKNIHYGKQIKVNLGNLWGEVNLHYGKKGFSVVKSTKSGSDDRITEAVALVIMNLLYDEPQA